MVLGCTQVKEQSITNVHKLCYGPMAKIPNHRRQSSYSLELME
jgi:hypothetical protein